MENVKTGFKCEHCERVLKTRASLLTHQNKTKICLAKQGRLPLEKEIEEVIDVETGLPMTKSKMRKQAEKKGHLLLEKEIEEVIDVETGLPMTKSKMRKQAEKKETDETDKFLRVTAILQSARTGTGVVEKNPELMIQAVEITVPVFYYLDQYRGSIRIATRLLTNSKKRNLDFFENFSYLLPYSLNLENIEPTRKILEANLGKSSRDLAQMIYDKILTCGEGFPAYLPADRSNNFVYKDRNIKLDLEGIALNRHLQSAAKGLMTLLQVNNVFWALLPLIQQWR